MVNIPRDVDDEFYRYKMPVLKAKVEGRGNGIKTVIENCVDIAKALDRSPEYVTKFFGFEVGALVSMTNDKYIVNGRHDPEDLAKILDLFIEKFVLCGGCRNPETNMFRKGDKLNLQCRACGKATQCDPTNRLISYITKKDEGEKKANKAPKPVVAQSSAQDEDDDEDWSLSTTKEAVEERRRALFGSTEKPVEKPAASTGAKLTLAPGQNPVDVLSKFFKTNPSPEEAFAKINELATAQTWSEGTLLRNYLFPCLFANDIKKDFYKKAAYLNLFVKGDVKQQKVVLYCIEKLCSLVPATVANLPSILNGFYCEEVLDEEILIQWWKHPIADPKRANPKASKAIRDSSKVFIDWLQTAANEASEEEF
uniref:W2 domain-containing protein n=1 Tax=Arcella intermedia TaxID=1963864 RepID=A0A6B2L7P6_9EUKA